jgi:hypothetical protein
MTLYLIQNRGMPSISKANTVLAETSGGTLLNNVLARWDVCRDVHSTISDLIGRNSQNLDWNTYKSKHRGGGKGRWPYSLEEEHKVQK